MSAKSRTDDEAHAIFVEDVGSFVENANDELRIASKQGEVAWALYFATRAQVCATLALTAATMVGNS